VKTSIWRRARAAAACVVVAGALGGCEILDPRVCHDGILYEVVPHQSTIGIGEGFTVRAYTESCPAGVQEIHPEWSAADDTVVQVEPQTGMVTGLRAGETEVRGAGDDGMVVVIARVTVE
jgi:hypothetical protein